MMFVKFIEIHKWTSQLPRSQAHQLAQSPVLIAQKHPKWLHGLPTVQRFNHGKMVTVCSSRISTSFNHRFISTSPAEVFVEAPPPSAAIGSLTIDSVKALGHWHLGGILATSWSSPVCSNLLRYITLLFCLWWATPKPISNAASCHTMLPCCIFGSCRAWGDRPCKDLSIHPLLSVAMWYLSKSLNIAKHRFVFSRSPFPPLQKYLSPATFLWNVSLFGYRLLLKKMICCRSPASSKQNLGGCTRCPPRLYDVEGLEKCQNLLENRMSQHMYGK